MKMKCGDVRNDDAAILLDSGHSWFICAACSWITMFYFSFFRAYSVLFPVLTRQYDFTRKMAYDVFGVIIVVSCFSGVGVSYVMKYTTPSRSMAFACILGAIGLFQLSFQITYPSAMALAAMYGIGRGIITTQTPTVINKHFKRHRTKAFGLYRAGYCVNQFIFSIAANFLVEFYGLKGCILIISAVVLNGVVGALALQIKPKQYIKSETDDTEKADSVYDSEENASFKEIDYHFSNIEQGNIIVADNDQHQNGDQVKEQECESTLLKQKQDPNDEVYVPTVIVEQKKRRTLRSHFGITIELLTNPMFIPILSTGLYGYMQFNVIAILNDVAIDKGVPQEQAYIIPVVFSIFEMTGYLGVGFITRDKIGLSRVMMISAMFLTGLANIGYCYASQLWQFLVIVAFQSTCIASSFVLMNTLMHDIMGERLFPRALGFTHMMGVLTYFVLAPLVGYYRDELKNYDPFLIGIGVTVMIIASTWLLEPFLRKRATSK